MNDLEICKRLAKIEGYKTSITDATKGVWASIYKNDCYDWYNPLTDDALNHQLMIKHKITVEFTRYIYHLKSSTTKAFYDSKSNEGYGDYIRDINPNKAILLAIIEAHK